MPEIARFAGMRVVMYHQQDEHNPPHVHVQYGGYVAAVSIHNGEIIDGLLPVKKAREIKKWVRMYNSELSEMWDTQVFRKLPPF